MGCCYSCEEEADRYAPSARPRPAPAPAPAPVPTVSRSWSCRYSDNDDRDVRCVPPASPVYEIKRPAPAPAYKTVPVPTPNVRPAVVIKPQQEFKPRPGALYGEYKCSCGYFWVSRLSWRDKSQQCKRCMRNVRPRNQRELRPSDFKTGDNEGLEHPQHLCEMCKHVGGYCGKYK